MKATCGIGSKGLSHITEKSNMPVNMAISLCQSSFSFIFN